MLEKDLELLNKILTDLKYTTHYREALINQLLKSLEDYKLPNLTRNFLYVSLVPEEGKERASEIADYWQQAKNTGFYKTNLEKALQSSAFAKYM